MDIVILGANLEGERMTTSVVSTALHFTGDTLTIAVDTAGIEISSLTLSP